MKPEWQIVGEFSKQRQDKLPSLKPGQIGTEVTAGRIYTYDSQWDKCRVGKGKRIPAFSEAYPEAPLWEDSVIYELAKAKKAQIFMTDSAAAAIMCSQKANYSWDVEVHRMQEEIFIQMRQQENIMHYQTVSETAQPDYVPADDESINGVRQLMKEAAKVSKDLLFAAQKPDTFTEMERSDPFEEATDQKMLRLGYSYKMFLISADTTVCIRCATHFQNSTGTEKSNLFALLEWNTKR